MANEQCCWPGCRLSYTSITHAGGKAFRLCDAHHDMIQDEDEKRKRRARNKLGMAMPEKLLTRDVNENIDAGVVLDTETNKDSQEVMLSIEERLANGEFDIPED